MITVNIIGATSLKYSVIESCIIPFIAAHECYNKPIDYQNTTLEDVKKYLTPILNSGHTSILEHASVTFNIQGISRACSHQIVRHRLASYTQESQRYALTERYNYVTPKTISDNNQINEEYQKLVKQIYDLYYNMVDTGIPKEDARYILPNASCTKLVMTMNYRELIHFLGLRMCNRAQWEIREVANQIYKLMTDFDAVVFGPDAYCKGPKCKMDGFCTEAKSCGLMPKKEK